MNMGGEAKAEAKAKDEAKAKAKDEVKAKDEAKHLKESGVDTCCYLGAKILLNPADRRSLRFL